MGTIVDVKKIVEKKKEELKERVELLKAKGIVPKLAVILANDDEASRIYVGNKRRLCEALGVESVEYILNGDVSTEEVLKVVDELNTDESVHGILVQLPLFKHLDENKIMMAIDSQKDVDGFHPSNLGKLLMRIPCTVACTPKGILTILQHIGVDLMGKDVTVIGRSVIVGKPVAHLLMNQGATVTICHSKTKDLVKHTKEADVLVVATGVPHLITADMVKPGAVVIDVGINRIEGKVIGDVDTQLVAQVASYVTPVPGGVGLTTVVSLLENLIEIAENK